MDVLYQSFTYFFLYYGRFVSVVYLVFLYYGRFVSVVYIVFLDPVIQSSGVVGLSPDYAYTLDNAALTPEQRRSYEENGFLVVKNCVPKEQLAKYR